MRRTSQRLAGWLCAQLGLESSMGMRNTTLSSNVVVPRELQLTIREGRASACNVIFNKGTRKRTFRCVGPTEASYSRS